MLYYDFNGVEGFKRTYYASNGKKKIILAYAKSKLAWALAKRYGNLAYLNITDMNELRTVMLDAIAIDRAGDRMNLCGYILFSDRYRIDDRLGVCEDGDAGSIRYCNVHRGGTFKMKAGKFFRMIALESEYGRIMPAPVLTWMCEEFARDWTAQAQQSRADYTLHYGKSSSDFDRIYTNTDIKGNFHSCMMDKDYYGFYTDSVDATAAWLEDKDGDMVARCVIYNEATDREGRVWRLAERQYSADQNEVLKTALVNALIREGLIDGYKRVGADCHDGRNFVDIDGNSLRDREFQIRCSLEYGDHVSYQDSFKYFDYESQTAYNYSDVWYSHRLDTTDGYIEDDRNYDAYHDRQTTSDLVSVHYHGESMSCAADDLEDFEMVDGAYHHYSDVFECDKCGRLCLKAERASSLLTGGDYCCDDCCIDAEERYAAERGMVYCEDSDRYEDGGDAATVMVWDGRGFVESHYTTKCVQGEKFPQLGGIFFMPNDLRKSGVFEEACRLSGVEIQNF